MAGWISLHRSIEKHWLYEEERKFSRFEAWVDLLLMVNHSDNKTMIDGKLVTVKRGQRITSLRKLGDRWNWSLTKVDAFLKLLEEDKMIVLKKDTKKTLVTIVNYDIYQNNDLEKRHRKDSEKTVKEHRKDSEKTQKKTNNNVNKENNDNKVISSSNNDNFKTVVNAYQDNIEQNPAPVTFQKIQQDFTDYGKDIMMYAIEKSALRNNHNYSFINFLLNDWKKKQLTTVDEIKQSEHNFEFKKQSTYSKQNQQKEMTPSWINQENTQKQDIDEEELERERQKLLEELNSNWENS
ncbi:DNA replication protein DnaD [Macrococcoides caseolyticum]|uniref:DnaD domain-containing protein n=1 Tax=Macrococcoides caseolyticum TaxID=69966 RepID=UPI000C3459E3|nr:DnaD domain protein [Macrococcus caseolyticus]PKE52737.1 DNA replication protein DnaD [Macrococcus caseolyticus]PKE72965.1 DNA replication protein DnaD [Macrococcus caseolyticus]PKF21674.1 DNA replication protein DnaD [Macrococcus caseolyticus]PKF35672.1 DNA replication protein DnaD [Macrococcus caseolyticus]PKF38454.1 DNA replication protein DnaD [Macrococcus caseolyticus]